jgi:hypothetical protein
MAASPAPAQDSWFVSVDGKSYGPYASEQIRAFLSEGRITPHSQVMPQGGRWAMACEQPQLAHLFAPPPVPVAGPVPVGPATAEAPSPPSPPSPGPIEQAAAPRVPQPVAAISPVDETGGEEALGKVIIIAELRTGSSVAFEAAVSRLGRSYRLNHYVWLLYTNVPIAQMRKELATHVGRNDPLFIADTTHQRAAWINFGPGADATIKALWRGL